jgi:hypothetical protein
MDFNKIREQYAKMEGNHQTNSGGGDFIKKFYAIPEGNSMVRILPSNDEDKLFYAETAIHRVPVGEGQTKNFHCRKVHGEACPICDTYYALWKDPHKDEDLARQIKPRARYYMNVVDRATDEVKIFSVGVILFKKIISTILDEDYGDVTDLEEGHDFKLNKVMEGQWPKYDQSVFRPKATAAGTKKQIAEWMDDLHDIHGLVKMEEYDTFKQVADTLMIGKGVPERSPNTSQEPDVSDEDYLSRLKG